MRSSKSTTVLSLAVLVSIACNEFPAAPDRVAVITESQASPWPNFFVSDTSMIRIDARELLGVRSRFGYRPDRKVRSCIS
ncbi:MAG: hypothetical protein ACYSUI_20155 [Planctomycetota bacterium]|jgi:hypothetical protein